MFIKLIGELNTYHMQLVGTGAVSVLFFAALLYCIREDRKNAPLILSPLCAISVAAAKVIDASFCRKEDSRRGKIFTVIFTVCILALAAASSGKDLVTGDMSQPAGNDMHIPGDLTAAMDILLEDEGELHVLTMPGWGVYFKAYSSRFMMMYDDPKDKDPGLLEGYEWTAYTELMVQHPDMRKVAASARRSGCAYVVLSNDIWPERPITFFGYEPVYEGEVCTVYREVKAP